MILSHCASLSEALMLIVRHDLMAVSLCKNETSVTFFSTK